jgi:aminopeptidase N
MIVTAPSHYQVVSNGLLVEETDLGDGRRLTHWRQAVPIATWLNAVGIARFAVQHLGTFGGGVHESTPVQTWVYPQDRNTGFEVFADPTIHVLRYYSDKIGPYVYEKLANVQSNSVGGGMESATSIFYGDESATGARAERWRDVIIHEIAHQWFGNAVTEYDWDDVWLSEGFATYFTSLFIEHAHGRDVFEARLDSSRDSIYSFYADRPEYRIVHDDLDDMSRVTTGMQYQKGAWVLHMLREMMGDDAFWRGIRAYWRTHVNGNATTADFRRFMERSSGLELRWFFDQWLRKGGVPVLDVAWSIDEATDELLVAIDQVQASETTFAFELPLDVGREDGTSVSVVCPVSRRETECRFDLGELQPGLGAGLAAIEIDPDHTVLVKASVTRR